MKNLSLITFKTTIVEIQNDQKLDNPVWFSLTETHQHFAVNYKNVKFYHPDYCPFGGFEKINNISAQVDEYAKITDSFFIVGEKPAVSSQLKLKKELICLQMTIDRKIDTNITDDIKRLTTDNTEALYQLVSLVQPGYFKRKTPLLGDYFGIFKDHELIAVTGERMKMDDFTEVSAVITHPHHTGKGYAKQLLAHTVNNILAQNKTPYLHVTEDNSGAIKLYEKSGFRIRRQISFWHITK